jgi:lysophospholipid acyltransferase (LPLAT)-like uncharacterized protein
MTVKRGPSDLSHEPLSYRFLITVLGTAAHRLFSFLYRTSRKHWIGREFEERAFAEGRPIIMAQYHYWDIFYFFSFRHRHHAIMCGDRWGGDLGAFLMSKIGIETVRRTTRPMDEKDPGFISGTQAEEELIRMVNEEGYNGTITVDGPRGPIFSVKHGVIDLAAATGAPIIAMSVAARPHITVPTWDRMWAPSPFSTIVMVLSEPLYVPLGADQKGKEEARQVLEQHMVAVKDLCERASADRKMFKALVRGDIPIPPLTLERDR